MILYVEQSDDDTFCFARCLQRLTPKVECRHVTSLHDAKCYLKGDGIYADRHEYLFPDLVLATFTLCDGTGLDLARWAKSQAAFAALPFCLFTDDVPPQQRTELCDPLPKGAHVFEKPSCLNDWPAVLKQILAHHPHLN